MNRNDQIPINSQQDLEGMKKSGAVTADILDQLCDYIKEGVTTYDIEVFCSTLIAQAGAISADLGYKGFPAALCTSVNNVVCHGIPSKNEVLKQGDIVNVDISIIINGYYGDSSRMYSVGKISPEAKKLCDITFDAMWIGINVCKPGINTLLIGEVIEDFVMSKPGFSIVKNYCGHGIGKSFHMEPSIFHHRVKNYPGHIIKPGMIFTIEPMINCGLDKVYTDNFDKWTVRTRSGKLSAQFEHTIVITENGFEVITLSKKGCDKPYLVNNA